MQRELFDYGNAVLFTLAALLPIVNPLGSAPIFLSTFYYYYLALGFLVLTVTIAALIRLARPPFSLPNPKQGAITGLKKLCCPGRKPLSNEPEAVFRASGMIIWKGCFI